MKEGKKIRFLMAKVGMDGHDRGAILVSLALRDAGMEVLYIGRRRTPEQIAEAAVQEDVDIVGLSSLADAHRILARRVVEELRKRGSDIPVILGGFIQPEDIPELKQDGISEVFGVGTKLDEIVNYVRQKVAAR